MHVAYDDADDDGVSCDSWWQLVRFVAI